DTLNRIERVTAIYQRQYRVTCLRDYRISLSPRSFRDTAQLPCFVVPPTQTARFFDRDDVIEKVEKHLQDGDPTSSLRSLALYGMGGVGKSHITIKYLEKKQLAKEFDAIFWIKAKNPISIQQSFIDIAVRLKLPDTGLATHDENRMILKGWRSGPGTYRITELSQSEYSSRSCGQARRIRGKAKI
ncbi:NB-ARC domain protein, partial [Aspergillus sclerotialis]